MIGNRYRETFRKFGKIPDAKEVLTAEKKRTCGKLPAMNFSSSCLSRTARASFLRPSFSCVSFPLFLSIDVRTCDTSSYDHPSSSISFSPLHYFLPYLVDSTENEESRVRILKIDSERISRISSLLKSSLVESPSRVFLVRQT